MDYKEYQKTIGELENVDIRIKTLEMLLKEAQGKH